MAQLPVMPLYTDALLADTLHLSTTELGAYMLLLIAMWRSGGSLPDDDTVLRRIARVPANNWPRVREQVLSLMTVEAGRVTQKRLGAEFEKTASKSRRAADAGRRGGLQKARNLLPQREADVLPQREEGVLAEREGRVLPQGDTHSPPKSLKDKGAPVADATSQLQQNASDATSIHIHIQDKKERETSVSPKKAPISKRGTRISEGWEPSDTERLYAASKGLPPPRIDREAELFRNYWMAAPGERGVKLDWSATWRNWVINAVERKPEATAKAKTTGWSLPAQSPGRRA